MLSSAKCTNLRRDDNTCRYISKKGIVFIVTDLFFNEFLINNTSELDEGKAKKAFLHYDPIYCRREIMGNIINLSNFDGMLINYSSN